ncbi:hypothetical protein O3P69_002699 [Scylla paramamosain]|uniref:C2H2-type domain-containing protein n=1 Tax=Scylla paramamosain TaxID=85552 RepID=A0AAW0UPJ0_SCYPA
MEVTNPAKECCVCGRQLSGSRWVRGSNQLRHSGRAIAEALGEVLACEVQLSWVCFRCYRLVLGLDYHTHQQEKQRLALLRLYSSRDKIEQQALGKGTLYDIGDCGSGRTGPDDGGSARKEVLDNLDISQDASPNKGHAQNQKFDQSLRSHATCEADNKILSYSLQSVCDHEYHRNDGQDSQLDKPATVLEGHNVSSSQTLVNQCFTEKLVPVTLNPSVKDSNAKDKQSESTDPKNGRYFKDSFYQDHKKQCGEEKEIATTPAAVSLPQRPAAKRRKTAKKWDDFEYYEDESKTAEPECDKIDTFPSAHQFRLPSRTGRKKCQKCKQEFASKKAILNHKCPQMKRMEREKVRYKCKGCLHVFLLRREYIKHVNACYKNTPVTCNLCLVKLPSAAYLPRHLAALHQVKSHLTKGDILCELCGRGFSRKEALERHEARVHGKAHGSHQCPLCGHTFPHTSLLAEHLRAHQGYTCPECSKVFSCRSNLTLHRRAHHMRKAAYHCTACNRHWKFHASYIYHMKKFHRSSEHKCPGCRLLLYSEEALHQHSMTCAGQDTGTTSRIGEEEAFSGRRQGIDEERKQTSDTTDALLMTRCPPTSGSLGTRAQLTKESSSFVLVPGLRKTEMYKSHNNFSQGPPECEIVVEVVEETDTDCQYIILVEDVANAHLAVDEASMWNTQNFTHTSSVN